jgi:hypothetical protein
MKLFAALHDDLHQGWVWLQDRQLPARSVVKITNSSNGRSVYCEVLQIDTNFLEKYNQAPRFSITDPTSSLVIGAWYRDKLGVITQSDIPLTVKARNCWLGRFRACTDHPQIVVRVAAWLGAIGLLLGVIGLVLGLWSACPKV